MTARQRWYSLHRARRDFVRWQRNEAWWAMLRVGADAATRVSVMRIVDALINPPIIIDPSLPDNGIVGLRKGKLP